MCNMLHGKCAGMCRGMAGDMSRGTARDTDVFGKGYAWRGLRRAVVFAGPPETLTRHGGYLYKK